MQLKSLNQLGVEGYTVLLNSSTSDSNVLSSSDVVRDFVEAEDKKGTPLDNPFFKFMCGKQQCTLYYSYTTSKSTCV